MPCRDAPGVVLVALLLAGCASGPAPAIAWSERIGDGTGATVASLVTDAAGRSALLGSFSGTLDLGTEVLEAPDEAEGVFVAMLDEHGAPLWGKELGKGPSTVQVMGLGVGGEHTVVYGTFAGDLELAGTKLTALSNDIFLLALDARGRRAWTAHFGADDGGPTGTGIATPPGSVAVDASGDVLLTGLFEGTIGFGGPPLDTPAGEPGTFVARLDPAGGYLWSTLFGEGTFVVEAIAPAPGGNAIIAGTNAADGNHPFVTSGPFVAELGVAGELLWQAQLSSDDFAQVSSLSVDAQGSSLVAGSFQGKLALGSVALHNDLSVPVGFVAKVSPAGKLLWARQFGDGTTDALAVTSDPKGDVLLAGSYQGTLGIGAPLPERAQQPGAYLARLDANGRFRSSRGFGASPEASAISSIAFVGEDLVVGGDFQGTLDVGADELVSAGVSDAFVARLRP